MFLIAVELLRAGVDLAGRSEKRLVGQGEPCCRVQLGELSGPRRSVWDRAHCISLCNAVTCQRECTSGADESGKRTLREALLSVSERVQLRPGLKPVIFVLLVVRIAVGLRGSHGETRKNQGRR